MTFIMELFHVWIAPLTILNLALRLLPVETLPPPRYLRLQHDAGRYRYRPHCTVLQASPIYS